MATFTHDGTEYDTENLKFLSLDGRNLVVYLDDRVEMHKDGDGNTYTDRRPRPPVSFKPGAGMYPPPGEEVDPEIAKKLFDHPKYGKLFKKAADPREVQSASDRPRIPEGHVELNGRIMPKEEALAELGLAAEADGASGDSDNEPLDDTSPVEAPDADTLDVKDLTPIEDVTSKQEALEALAAAGVDMSDAPAPRDTTDEIARFAIDQGYFITKYGEPEGSA